jgi:GDPmannose 4,6-dehydratase
MAKTNIIYLKTPKTGSSSIRNALIQYCNKHGLHHINKTPKNILKHVGGIGASLGHMPYEDKYIDFIKSRMNKDNKTLLITSIREPLSRFLSNFRYTYGGHNFNNFYKNKHLKKAWDNMSDNLMARYFGFHKLEDITEENIRNRFDHVIIAEDYDNSLAKLSEMLGYELKSMRSNVGKNHKEIKVAKTTLELFKKRNSLDYKLYELCVKIYGMKKKVLITGINGQDGRYLAEFLLDKGYTVVGVAKWEVPEDKQIGDVEYEYCDLMGDPQSLYDILQEHKPDEIYNLAAQSAIAPSWTDPIPTLKINCEAVLHILDYINYVSPETRFFNAASAEMFGYATESPQTENSQLRPRNPYGSTKVLAHNMIGQYRKEDDLFVCSGILYNHESRFRDISMVTRKITNGVAKIHLGLSDNIELGNLDAVRDWGYAPDYCEAMWKILQHDTPDDYIISSGKGRTIEDFLTAAFDVVGITDWKKYVTVNEKFVRPVEPFTLIGDNSKLRGIGWEPETRFEDMVELMVKSDIKRLNNE